MSAPIERRFLSAEDLRVATDGELRKIAGHSALFNSPSEDLGGFTETIAPGAFRDAIASSDIRALFNHDPNFVLGRVRSGTLSVTEDECGLAMEVTPPEATWANDLLVSMQRGDINQQSFAFSIAKGGDEWQIEDDAATRTITKVARLYDVSVVTYPAYPDTAAAVRSLESWKMQKAPAPAIPPALVRDIKRRRLRITTSL